MKKLFSWKIQQASKNQFNRFMDKISKLNTAQMWIKIKPLLKNKYTEWTPLFNEDIEKFKNSWCNLFSGGHNLLPINMNNIKDDKITE